MQRIHVAAARLNDTFEKFSRSRTDRIEWDRIESESREKAEHRALREGLNHSFVLSLRAVSPGAVRNFQAANARIPSAPATEIMHQDVHNAFVRSSSLEKLGHYRRKYSRGAWRGHLTDKSLPSAKF